MATQRIEALLKATHALSDYRLVLKQGEPFTPVVLRVHPDPIAIVGKVLEQNPKSYTKIQDLLDLGASMVEAGLTVRDKHGHSALTAEQEPAQRSIAGKRITAMCIDAALTEDDFENGVLVRGQPAGRHRRAGPGQQQVAIPRRRRVVLEGRAPGGQVQADRKDGAGRRISARRAAIRRSATSSSASSACRRRCASRRRQRSRRSSTRTAAARRSSTRPSRPRRRRRTRGTRRRRTCRPCPAPSAPARDPHRVLASTAASAGGGSAGRQHGEEAPLSLFDLSAGDGARRPEELFRPVQPAAVGPDARLGVAPRRRQRRAAAAGATAGEKARPAEGRCRRNPDLGRRLVDWRTPRRPESG